MTSLRSLPAIAGLALAVPAAIAARCAGKQGRYWEYRESVFREQHRLAQEA